MTPFLVSHYAVDEIFPKVAGYLQTALGTHTGWTIGDLATLCSNRGGFLFVDDCQAPHNALVGRFEVWGGEPVFNCIAMGGSGSEDWQEAMEHIKQFAAIYGAKSVVFHGRKGWQRALNAEVIYQTYRMAV